jgi:acyl carrier protein
MKKQEFIEALINEFTDASELDPIHKTLDTKFINIEGFDSLSVVSLAAFIKTSFGVNIVEKKLNSVDTIGELMELIGMEHFED